MKSSVKPSSFPTSRFGPVPLARPLEVFGKKFAVEISSHLCLGPDTVLRAAIGKSIQTLLREEGKLLPLKQLSYALQGKHKLTTTTRTILLRSLGQMASSVASVLDGGPVTENWAPESDWKLVAASWGALSDENIVDVIVASFIQLDEFALAAEALKAANRSEEAEALLATRFSQTLPSWREICPDVSVEGCIRIETSLLVLAEAEAIGSLRKVRPAGQPSAIESLLAAGAKPMGHWLSQVVAAARCSDLRDLSALLDRKQIRHQMGRAISHDTLKGWSSMKPGMLMSLEGCQSLLAVIPDERARDLLRSRFAMARFLAFLCDFLRASVRAEQPTWTDAQRMLLARYLLIANGRGGRLPMELLGAEGKARHPLEVFSS